MPLNWLGATVALSSAAAGGILANRIPVGTNPRWVAVADIGQGNCNVVFDDDGRPVMYYDLGGGVITNAFTYPLPQPTFCYDVGHCLFVVSHWDRDHYQTLSIATNNGQLNNVHVLVPQQEPGNTVTGKGTASNMINKIIVAPVNATLYVWQHEDPNALSGNYVAASGNFAVIKVTGGDVNNTGLAVRLEDPAVAGRYMLLTGDATFQNLAGHVSFPHGADQHCVGLVAGHHGAAVESLPDTPRPEPGAASFLIAYSFGWGNSHGHPRVDGGVDAYDGRGWVDDHRMDTGGAELAARYAGPRGNVGLLWPGAAAGPGNAVPGLAPAAVDNAAIALLASAAAEVSVAAVGLAAAGVAAWRQVAAGAVAQAAVECGAPAVAAALAAPANGVALAAVAGAAPPVLGGVPAVDPALAGAIAAAPAAAALAGGPGRRVLAAAVTDVVMLAFARAAQILTAIAANAAEDAAQDARAAGAPVHIGDQAKAAARAAYSNAADPATVAEAAAAIPADFIQRALAAANAVSPANMPTATQLAEAVAEATCDGVQGRLGRPGQGQFYSQPPYTAARTAAAAPRVAALVRDDIATAIAAAVGCVPAVPINPGSEAPKTLVVNENAKIVARVAAVAALCAPPIAAPVTRDQVAAAAVAAARVVLPAAQGAPQVGCHRHPRTCGQPACSLSLHYFYGMFPARITTAAGSGANAYAGENVPAANAGLASPQAVLQDAQFNTYVCDTAANRIRRIGSGGSLATLAGPGGGAHGGDANAPATAAQLDAPAAVAVDEQRNLLYVADRARHRVRRVDLSTGQISAFAGTGAPGPGGDGGPATAAQLLAPEGLAYDSSRDVLYIADTGNHRVRVVEPATGVITTVAGTGAAGDGPDGLATACALRGPTGLYVVGGDLYIADTGNHRVRVLEGADITVVAGQGFAAGAGFYGNGISALAAQFSQPRGVAASAAGVVYIADTGNRRIRRVDPATGVVTRIAGTGAAGSTGDNNPALGATFQAPSGLAITPAGDLCVADPLAFRVRRINLGTGVITTLAGAAGAAHAAGPVALPGQLTAPQQLACTAAGAVFIADSGAHTVCRVLGGLLADVAGNGNAGDAGDAASLAANAGLSAPAGLALDRGTRTLYFSDSGSHCVRQVDLATRIVSRVAGQPNAAGGGGDNAAALAAHLSNPGALAFDDVTRVLYICDEGNNRVRAVDLATGMITTEAGAGAPGARGAALNQPSAIALDFDGNLYVATAGDHRVRRVNLTTNAIDLTVGTGAAGDAGDNGPLAGVQLHTPRGLAVDGAGVIYVSCAGTNRVRCLDQHANRAYALAGDGNAGFHGDGGLPPLARLTGPRGLHADEAGRNLLIADTGNFRVRRCRL
jgi:sugar lactone lactonase YvrE